jgi:molybdopterin synthase sulfur carrier subunit
MPTVHIPAAMRPVTGDRSTVVVTGETLAAVIDGLEAEFPGIKARLVDGEKLRSGMAVFVDGVMASTGLRTRLKEESEVYFAPAIAGG